MKCRHWDDSPWYERAIAKLASVPCYLCADERRAARIKELRNRFAGALSEIEYTLGRELDGLTQEHRGNPIHAAALVRRMVEDYTLLVIAHVVKEEEA